MKSLLKKIIPARFHWSLYNWWRRSRGFQSKAYSSFGEDLCIAKLVEHKKRGFYVDIGAFHPQKYSNTEYLRKYYGWRGINIEPNPDNFRIFEKQRTSDINIQCGVAAEADELTYYQFVDPLFNTFSVERVKELETGAMLPVGVQKIPVKPLRQILDEVGAIPAIDLLNIDVENFDLEVLQSLDWDAFQPSVVCVEDHKMDIENKEHSEIYQFLKARDYGLKNQCSFTSLYKRKD